MNSLFTESKVSRSLWVQLVKKKKCFSVIECKVNVVIFPHFLLSHQQSSLRRVCFVLHSLPSRIYVHWLLFSPCWTVPALSASLHMKDIPVLNHFSGSVVVTLQYICVLEPDRTRQNMLDVKGKVVSFRAFTISGF